MGASVSIPATQAKGRDYDAARELGVSPRTVKAWRLGERHPPAYLIEALKRHHAERLRKAIAAMQQELADAEAGL